MQHAAQYANPLDRKTVADAVRAHSPRLWAAVSLPFLALEALSVGIDEYAVVTEPTRRGKAVCAASANARSIGIEPGMSVNAALAMCSGLRLCPRDPGAERDCLNGLHRWAGRFTPAVSTSPASLLFEISASLRLFGGVRTLYDRLRLELDQTRHHCYLAVTPTPGASSVLTLAGQQKLITEITDLRASMHGLPVHFLGLTGETLRRLRATGVSFLEELWRLPRHDLARRFGPEVVRKLDQVLGMHPDPQRIDAVPARFERYCELEAETVEAGFILPAALLLLQQFSDFLAAGSAVAGHVLILLEHPGGPATRIDVGTRLPTRDTRQWKRLLGEHLQHHELRAPVVGVRLSGSASRDGGQTGGDLFHQDATRDWACVLDELEARLGEKSLWMPEVVADHRPEYAWQRSPPAPVPRSAASHQPHRPLWLLPEPRRLNCRIGHAPGTGALDIISGPERIESGWWDDREYCRDYYTAVCPRGRRLWIFQDLKKRPEWYLHGLFG